ncbi:MAG: MBL fold metallo-hydrolase [Clostridia bacterium]
MFKFCSLFSGSSGNALIIWNDQTRILIDAGVSGKRIQAALEAISIDPRTLDAILVTHEHSDHASCVGVMSRRFNLPVYATRGTWKGMAGCIGGVNVLNIRYFSSNEAFVIKNIEIRPFTIPHDAADPVGFSFLYGGRKITVATDIGHMNDSLIENIIGSDLLMLESNHDMVMLEKGRYPLVLKKRIKSDYGHLCNDIAGQTIAGLAMRGGRRFLIGHLSAENNYPELAYETVSKCIAGSGFCVGNGIELHVAGRNEASMVFDI